MTGVGFARALRDLGARLFDLRSGSRAAERQELHAHWNPEVRDWRYHVHSPEPDPLDDDQLRFGG